MPAPATPCVYTHIALRDNMSNENRMGLYIGPSDLCLRSFLCTYIYVYIYIYYIKKRKKYIWGMR